MYDSTRVMFKRRWLKVRQAKVPQKSLKYRPDVLPTAYQSVKRIESIGIDNEKHIFKIQFKLQNIVRSSEKQTFTWKRWVPAWLHSGPSTLGIRDYYPCQMLRRLHHSCHWESAASHRHQREVEQMTHHTRQKRYHHRQSLLGRRCWHAWVTSSVMQYHRAAILPMLNRPMPCCLQSLHWTGCWYHWRMNGRRTTSPGEHNAINNLCNINKTYIVSLHQTSSETCSMKQEDAVKSYGSEMSTIRQKSWEINESTEQRQLKWYEPFSLVNKKSRLWRSICFNIKMMLTEPTTVWPACLPLAILVTRVGHTMNNLSPLISIFHLPC